MENEFTKKDIQILLKFYKSKSYNKYHNDSKLKRQEIKAEQIFGYDPIRLNWINFNDELTDYEIHERYYGSTWLESKIYNLIYSSLKFIGQYPVVSYKINNQKHLIEVVNCEYDKYYTNFDIETSQSYLANNFDDNYYKYSAILNNVNKELKASMRIINQMSNELKQNK